MLELADAFPMLSKHSMEECSVQIPVFISPNHLFSPGCGATARAPGKASAFGWARAEKGSRLTQLPHFQFKEIMKRRKCQQERLGPGTYNIRDFLQETRPSSLRGICDTREQRFRDAHRDCFPSPGTYGPRGNPYARLEERDERSASTRGLMDSRTAKCAPLAAVASPAPCPGYMPVGWPSPTAERGPCRLSPRTCRAAAPDLAPTACGAASMRGCGGGRAASAPASPSQETGRSSAVVVITPWRCVAPGFHHRTGFLIEPWRCQPIAIRMESCLTPASVPLGYCSLTSLGCWKNTPAQQHFGSERAAGSVQESGLVPVSSGGAELSWHGRDGAARETTARQRRGTELSTGTVKGFLDELTLKENKKKGCFSTLPRNPGCPMERIFWATLSQCPREAYVVGPGSYNPKPIERSAYSSQPPFWSSAKRFDRKSYRLFTGNEQHQQHVAEPVQNPVGVGRYDITKHEKYPQKMRYQSLYRCDAQRYLSNLKQDAYLLEQLKPVAKKTRSDVISASRCPDTSEEMFSKRKMVLESPNQ
ncbi:ciliary microtubule-associated protein 2 [Morphnus guianensis]